MPRVTNIQQRGGTAAEWASANPVLAARELGLETDTRKVKFGNGTGNWNSLPYISADSPGKADTAWIISRGTDLVSNGTGLLGDNTNFSAFTYNADAPAGAAGAFDKAGAATVFNDEDIPVDTSRRYLFRFQAMQRNQNVPESRFYSGISPRDKQSQTILPHNYSYKVNTTTTLTAALNPGDTVINVTSTANWNTAAAAEGQRYIGIWNWADPDGRVWPQHTYTRNTSIYTALTATTLTLKTAYAGPAMPAGTPLSNTLAGGNYMYVGAGNTIMPLTWTTYEGTVGGLHDGTAGAATTKFPPGTAFVRVMWLATYAVTSIVPAGQTSVQSFASISFSDATQALKELDTKAPLNSPAFTGTPTGITKSHVGLGNVDNTSDSAKPVSTATQTALNGKANVGHSHSTADVTGLDTALAGKADTGHTHTTANITGLDTALAGKAPLSHSHDSSDITDVDGGITTIKQRSGTASAWTSANPVLAAGEMGYESDTGKIKFGNGSAVWSALNYAIPGGTGLQTLDPSGAWQGWQNAVANMANETVRILNVGDSITEGTGVSNITDGWPYKLAAKLRDAYPTIAANDADSLGWTPVIKTSSTLNSIWTIAGTYTTTATFGFRGTLTAALSQNATITGTVTGTSIDVWHAKGTASGTFTVKVDGVQVGGNYGGTAAATSSGYKQRVSLGSAGSHTVVITNNSAGTVYINGVTVFNGNENAGLTHVNAGRHGWTSSNWVTTANHPNWDEDIAALNPHLVTILLGANDYTGLTGRNAYKENLRVVVDKIRDSQQYWSSICLVACFKRSESATPSWEHYEFAMQSLAAEMGLGFLDLREIMPDVGSAEAVSNGYYVDTVHPGAAGYTRMADEISEYFLARANGLF
jgi:lysophospholipase L1-like esterase